MRHFLAIGHYLSTLLRSVLRTIPTRVDGAKKSMIRHQKCRQEIGLGMAIG